MLRVALLGSSGIHKHKPISKVVCSVWHLTVPIMLAKNASLSQESSHPWPPKKRLRSPYGAASQAIIPDHDAEIRPVQKSDQALESGENENETK